MREYLMDWNNLKADYERLGSWAAVATEYGVTKGAISHHARAQGLSTKSRSLNIDFSELPTLYADGMTYEQLATHYGCSVHAIQDAVERLEVAPRPTGVPVGYEWDDARRVAHRAAIDRPEWREKNRENLLRRLPSMSGPSANSPLERLLQLALIKAGVSFSTQRVLLKRYCVDILLTQNPVIIEADGALHHLRRDKDAERDAACVAAGYRVFRFNGTQINHDPDGCIRQVVDACGIEPDLEPVADIRNGMLGAENPNWGGGHHPHVCTQCGTTFYKVRSARAYKKTFCNSKCYGAWLRDNPDQSNVHVRWNRASQVVTQSELHGDVQS
jgi:very-short-patch-repair endonuclease